MNLSENSHRSGGLIRPLSWPLLSSLMCVLGASCKTPTTDSFGSEANLAIRFAEGGPVVKMAASGTTTVERTEFEEGVWETEITSAALEGVLQGVDQGVGRGFKLRYEFDVYSVLICELPPPRATLGYFHWKTSQLFDLTQTVSDVKVVASYEINLNPQWAAGKDGLPRAVQAP